MNFLTREDLSEKLTSLSTALSEQATVFNLYPLFKKATSSSPEPTPGYLYDILIEFSYKNRKNSELLGEYMNKRLQRHSAHGVLKTLKCVHHLVQRGSRGYRIYLRRNDEHVKNAPNYGSEKNAYSGTARLEEIKALTESILRDLFLQESIERDTSTGPEVPPQNTQALSGMGFSKELNNKNKNKDSIKYQGFGNSPIDRSGVTDSIRDVLEHLINAPDPKEEILQECLSSSRGHYQAARVNIEESAGRPAEQPSKPTPPKQHVPGQVGGGWEEDDSEDEFVEFGGLRLDSAEDDPMSSITDTDEFEKIRSFCVAESSLPVDLDELEGLVEGLRGAGDSMNMLHSINHVLQTETEHSISRALVLVERLYETSVLQPSLVLSLLRTNLEARRLDGNKFNAVKSSKILATLDFLKDYKLSSFPL